MNMKFWVGIMVVGAFFLRGLTASAAEPLLRLGDRNPAVVTLQKALNTDPDTKVSVAGSGSVGFETDYFGPKTREAVVRFQQKHAAVILKPLGLSVPTGIVGEKTWAVLLALSQSPVAVVPKQNSLKTPYLIKIEPKILQPSAIATLSGLYFGTENKIVIDGSKVLSAASDSASTLTFQLPTSLSVGAHELTVSNGSATSTPLRFTVSAQAVGTSTSSGAPVITSLDPSRAGKNTVITIYGDNFDRTDNTVYTGYAELTGIPSPDGKTIRITLDPPFIASAQMLKYTIPLWFFVENDHGTSNEAILTYTF